MEEIVILKKLGMGEKSGVEIDLGEIEVGKEGFPILNVSKDFTIYCNKKGEIIIHPNTTSPLASWRIYKG